MKIIRTASYIKLAGVDPRSIEATSLGIAIAARDAFGRSFPALEKVSSMLSSRGRTNSEVISGAINEIEEIFGLCEINPGALTEGYVEALGNLGRWLDQIKEQQDLDNQWNKPPYNPEGQ